MAWDQFETVDATDLAPINTGTGGLGLGAPWSPSNPAIAADSGYSSLGPPINIAPTGPQKLTLQPSPAQSATAGTPQSGRLADTISNYFWRALVIITGFIFLAVGLNMIRPGTVSVPGRTP